MRYQMRQRLLSIGDDYWIEDEAGNRVFRVDGKAMRLRKTMYFEDADGQRHCRIQTRVMHLRDTMEIEDPDGNRIAMVHKKLITPLRERWKVDVEHGEDLEVKGNIVNHEYEIEQDGHKVAEVSKQWFRRAGLLRRRDRPRAGRPAAARHHRRHRLHGPPAPGNGPTARTGQTRRASTASRCGGRPESSSTSASSVAPQSTARTRKSASARAVAGSSRKPDPARSR